MTTLHEKGNRYYGEVLNLRAEVKMLRDWAKLLNLSPPATIPPQNEPTSGMIDSNYEYCTQGEKEEEKLQKCADDGKNGDEANLMDVIKTEDVSETFVDSVEIGEPIKREKRFKCICQPLEKRNKTKPPTKYCSNFFFRRSSRHWKDARSQHNNNRNQPNAPYQM